LAASKTLRVGGKKVTIRPYVNHDGKGIKKKGMLRIKNIRIEKATRGILLTTQGKNSGRGNSVGKADSKGGPVFQLLRYKKINGKTIASTTWQTATPEKENLTVETLDTRKERA